MEDFSTSAVWARWTRGPSAPPAGYPAYHALEETSEAMAPADGLGSSAIDLSLPLEPGCRALLPDGSVVVLVKRQRPSSPLARLRLSSSSNTRWRTYRLGALADETVEDEANLRLVRHRGEPRRLYAHT